MKVLCGVRQVKKTPLEPYAGIVCSFLEDYSNALRQDLEAKQYPDVMTFAFWARRANIEKQKQEYKIRFGKQTRLGKGILFHVAPSNVPVNFMFSYAFGLLAGNANIVRVPSKEFPQVQCMCRILEEVLGREQYHLVYSMTSIVRYDREDRGKTDWLSGLCNMRIIWGGDDTIRSIRKSELHPRSTEITFADRYSFGMISTKKLQESTEAELSKLAEAFYNDTYLMDQNACSTPHLICWKRDGLTDEIIRSIQNRFWEKVHIAASQYDLADIKVSEKYALLCEKMIKTDGICNVQQYDNLLYVCTVKEVDVNAITNLRGKYGLFFQYEFEQWEELISLSDEKVQTCAVYGIDVAEWKVFLQSQHFIGIDRIVPFGKTLDIDVIWDGYDLVAQMSRIISTC